jgi:drug/metabolite transporter (DMT)-like permease
MNAKSFIIAIMAGLGNMGSVMTQKLYNTYSGGTVADFQLATYAVSAAVLALLLLAFYVRSRATARVSSDAAETVNGSALRGKVLLFVTIAIVMMYISQFLSTYASASIPSAVFYPLSYVISMPLIYFCDVVIYKERVTARGIVGIILVTLAGVLINLKL